MMNERIRELAEQAWKEIYTETAINGSDNPAPSIDEVVMFEKKFAESIVRECAKVASNQVMDVEGNDWGVRRAVEKHFGVEE